ncbi:hypothetical protein Nepgr_017953 [Nepenthes gracilis]|uniref:Uncharacterized protein n=1 Tax=Nepenthes gracilis TaxID=150966 RepID=A0AAD3ST88_NEPGR|nr:hypothetical protein Nepgr_017953 [Nepenthes gracilis]
MPRCFLTVAVSIFNLESKGLLHIGGIVLLLTIVVANSNPHPIPWPIKPPLHNPLRHLVNAQMQLLPTIILKHCAGEKRNPEPKIRSETGV